MFGKMHLVNCMWVYLYFLQSRSAKFPCSINYKLIPAFSALRGLQTLWFFYPGLWDFHFVLFDSMFAAVFRSVWSTNRPSVLTGWAQLLFFRCGLSSLYFVRDKKKTRQWMQVFVFFSFYCLMWFWVLALFPLTNSRNELLDFSLLLLCCLTKIIKINITLMVDIE